MNKEINYVTYQTFPSNKANTFQTMDNIKYFEKNGYQVRLTFPLREKTSTSDKDVLKKFYPVSNKLEINGEVHNLPFGKFEIFEKYLFTISHFLWSWRISKKFVDNKTINYTRSDWVFYFLSRKNLNVVFECHQLSKIRKWTLKKSIKHRNSKVVFLNSQLLIDSKINNSKNKSKLLIAPNGVDDEVFNSETNKIDGQILFLGNIERFNNDRNLKFIIDCFKSKKIYENFSLLIIGGDKKSAVELTNYTKENSLDEKIEISQHVSRDTAVNYLKSSEIGLLTNSDLNKHSTHYTSPLKYFEYLYSGLKILAVDFPAHRNLPFSNNIVFFENNNSQSFQNALLEIKSKKYLDKKLLYEITLDSRIKKIIKFINS